MKHPGDPPDGFPCLPASGLVNPPFTELYSRFREAFNHAIACEDRGTGGETDIAIPCYVCGKKSHTVCMRCCRNLCNTCRRLGDHHEPDGRCEFIIEGRSPDRGAT